MASQICCLLLRPTNQTQQIKHPILHQSPKKNCKQNGNDIPDDVKDRKLPAVLKTNAPKTPEQSKDTKKDGPPSPPAKKIKAKLRKKKHKKQEIEKFKQLYKAIKAS